MKNGADYCACSNDVASDEYLRHMLRLIGQKITMQNLRQSPALLTGLLLAVLIAHAFADLGSGREPAKAPISPGAIRDRSMPSTITYLGVAIAEVTPDIGGRLPIDPGTGLVVNDVLADSPAARAGLQKGDIITRLNGQVLVTPKQLQNLVQSRKPGDRVEITYFRKGEMRKAAAMLATRYELPQDDPRQRR